MPTSKVHHGATASKSTKVPAKKPAATKAKMTKPTGAASKPVLLAGGNPQMAKADGDAPVQAYIAAMPVWKRDVGRRLDALIVRTVPGVRKAVKWNSPFYGVEGRGGLLNVHWMASWIRQAASIPGWDGGSPCLYGGVPL